MKKIIMPRGTGKTFKLIEESAKTGDYIVCHSQAEAIKIHNQANKLGYRIPFPLTYEEFLDKKYYGKNISGFLIDNVDMFVQSLTTVKINAITLAKD